MEPVFLHIMSGALGGGFGARLNAVSHMGRIANILAGMIGGLVGGSLLGRVLIEDASLAAIIGHLLAGFGAGAFAQTIAGMVKYCILR